MMTEQNTMTLVRAFAEIIERQVTRFENQGAEYERKLAEHQAAFAARTSADEKIIEWLRIKVQDARAERDALRAEVAALQERLRASIAQGDFAQMEVAALKSQTPKQSHPVAVGGYLRRLTGFNTTPAGEIARVTLVDDDDASHLEYEVVRPNGEKGRWSAKGCEPCDQPATHDTEAGKAAAESAVRTEPVAEEIKVGDLVEVFQAIGSMTDAEDIGCGGVVRKVDGFFVWLNRTDTMGLPREGIASLGDVKVTT